MAASGVNPASCLNTTFGYISSGCSVLVKENALVLTGDEAVLAIIERLADSQERHHPLMPLIGINNPINLILKLGMDMWMPTKT